MRAIRLLNPSILVKLVFVLMLLLMLSFTSSSLLAQDETPTEVPLSTETPVLPPTDVPTETVPTELPATPTEAVVTETPVTPEFTPPPTAESTPVLPPPVDPDYFFEDFQDADLSAWILTPGWSLLDENGNQVLTTAAPSGSAALSLVNWPYLSLSFRARVAPGANLN
ncbi:MAG: hypothetical protein JNJ78_06355, partial [Anaerolineae bacterium]|nr:hypothetical protein [Anaerolineae bacterium]